MSGPSHEAMRQAILDGDVETARALALAAVETGCDLLAVVEEGFSAGIRRVGELWEQGEYFLPELVGGAEAMKAAMAVLQPALASGRRTEPRGRVVIGTVAGDHHDIGKTLVATLLEANGFEVHDLGTDVTTDAFVAGARRVDADIVAASALLTTTMEAQRDLVRRVAEEGLDGRLRVLVGGAPTTAGWARQIGAFHAENAAQAVARAAELVG